MIGKTRKAKVRAMALELRAILRPRVEYFGSHLDEASMLYERYEIGLNDEEVEYFRTIVLFGTMKRANRFKKIMSDLNEFLWEFEEIGRPLPTA